MTTAPSLLAPVIAPVFSDLPGSHAYSAFSAEGAPQPTKVLRLSSAKIDSTAGRCDRHGGRGSANAVPR